MGAPQYEQAGADIGGTGTTNTIPRWTGPSTLGDSILSQSGTMVSASGSIRTANGSSWSSSDGGLYVASFGGGPPSYKIGFDSIGGTVGYIRYQVDIAASTHGHIFSAGPLNAPTNLMLVRADGNVGIGTASPTNNGAGTQTLMVNGSTTGVYDLGVTGARQGSWFYSGGSVNIGSIANVPFALVQNATIRWSINTSGHFLAGADNTYDIGASGATRPRTVYVGTSFDASASGAGLKLPATPGNADTQTLDAYRENTFTPTIQGGTTAGVGTYTSQVGTFTIIGRCLFFNVEIAWSAHTGTGPVQLAGLPVAAAQLATFGLDSNYAAAGYLRMSAGNTFAQINTINVPATGNYRVSGCYFIV